MGVWNVIQAMGEKVCEEEKELTDAHKAGKVHGGKEVPERLKKPLFEEDKVEELYTEILSSSKAPKKEGKGYQDN